MRQLILLKGAPGSGKSTWLKQMLLEQFTLSPDDIRMMFQNPVREVDGTSGITMRNDKQVWDLLFDLLEKRMSRGDFTVIDATHSRTEMLNQYKKLCQKYRYRCTVVDFTDVSLKQCLSQNKARPEHKHVPEQHIFDIYQRYETLKTPSWINEITPSEFENSMTYPPVDFSHWKKIHHIGDIHGCSDVLQQYLGNSLKEDELYIFTGDYIDRGPQNDLVVKFLLSIYELPNVIMLEGNHEIHLWRWANDEEGYSRVFDKQTQPQLENPHTATGYITRVSQEPGVVGRIKEFFGKSPEYFTQVVQHVDKESLGMLKKDVRQMYRRLRQVLYYTYGEKTVLVTHGGFSRIPNNLMYESTSQMISGVGKYEDDIDEYWDNNTSQNEYQLHGHRNIYRLPTQASARSFNLEGQIEAGGQLRAVTLTTHGFQVHELKNRNYLNQNYKVPKLVNAEKVTVPVLIDYLDGHKLVQEQHVQDNIVSYNFTRKAFEKGQWDTINSKARGLFINKETNKIVSRSYDKFFNVNERKESSLSYLADNLVFPVTAYSKPNGFLGLVGYDEETKKLILTTKSQGNGKHAMWFKQMFYEAFDKERVEFIKAYLSENNFTLTFEVISMTHDPHIIKYDGDSLVLLDIIKRQVQYQKLEHDHVLTLGMYLDIPCKELKFTFANWIEFYTWYKETQNDYTTEQEGYVIEDSSGFMTKIKLPYYSIWKWFRSLKETIAKGRAHEVRTRQFNTELHNNLFQWMKQQEPEYLKSTHIIQIREDFNNRSEEDSPASLPQSTNV